MTEAQRNELLQHWQETRQTVADLARAGGRDPRQVRIIAVSKKQPLEAVRILAQNGQQDFGENYVQEALQKQTRLDVPGVAWHFLGHLQRNKAKFVPGRFVMVHSLDSLPLARVLREKSEAAGLVLDVLLEVNLGLECRKCGISEEGLLALAESVAAMSSLSLKGLMALPPYELSLDEKQRAFARLARLRDRLTVMLGMTLEELSMGTTDDFPRAIAEGATMIRIGTRIFGPRVC